MRTPRGLATRLTDRLELASFTVALALLAAGAAAVEVGGRRPGEVLWTLDTLFGLALSTWWTARAVARRHPGVDLIAWLALVGTLGTRELLAGAVLTVMLTTGALLEARAGARARRELSLLVARAPRTARRLVAEQMVEVPVEEVGRGERLLVGTGEVVPVDGRLLTGAELDESALTGEAMPVRRSPGEEVRSGVGNAGAPLELLTTATSEDSTYAGVVRLVAQAQATSAPFVRLADRYAVAFVPFTVAVAGLAWLLSADPVRAVAVLVVATPCPLLLAVPIAILSGVSRAARHGVVIKGGAALEQLAAGRVLLFDKTGTLTGGRPVLAEVLAADPDTGREALRLAAGLEQVCPHVLAGAVVTAARRRGLPLELPTEVREQHGQGVEGRVGGHLVRVGRAEWIVPGAPPADLPGWVQRARARAALDDSLAVLVAVDGVAAAVLLLQDPIRPDAPRMVRALRRAGIERVVLVTGDRADLAETVGRIVGVDAVRSQRDPVDKLAVVAEESAGGATIMVGDGVNDAPALAAADVGVAVAARGVTAAAQAADVVLTVDRIDALADALLIARRSRRIARTAAAVGMGLCLVAMVLAAAGWLAPASGALTQELIDVLAIGIALVAVLPGPRHTVALPADALELLQRLRAEHAAVGPVVEAVRGVADALDPQRPDLAPVRALLGRLERELLPHERAEQEQLFPALARAVGSADPTVLLGRTHTEIEHQVGLLRRMLRRPAPDPTTPVDTVDLRRLLYGLYAILRLHNAQEEEEVFSLAPEPGLRAEVSSGP